MIIWCAIQKWSFNHTFAFKWLSSLSVQKEKGDEQINSREQIDDIIDMGSYNTLHKGPEKSQGVPRWEIPSVLSLRMGFCHFVASVGIFFTQLKNQKPNVYFIRLCMFASHSELVEVKGQLARVGSYCLPLWSPEDWTQAIRLGRKGCSPLGQVGATLYCVLPVIGLGDQRVSGQGVLVDIWNKLAKM